MRTVICAAMATVLAVSTAQAAIINVPADEPTIQAGIDAAVNGDVVIVAEGEYFENINFNGKAITVRSTDPNDMGVVMGTIINGGGTGRVVTCTSGEGPNTVLSGFVITNGGGVNLGGGMRNDGSSPMVTNCSFIGNSANNRGGGMYNLNGDPTVTNCTFSGNTALAGGGMYNGLSNPTVANCTFSGNTAGGSGGGMYNNSSNPTVANCSFIGNSAGNRGGGMFNSSSSPTVTNCSFSGNSAGLGGGMNNTMGTPTVTNCSFSGNTAGGSGGGMNNEPGTNATVSNTGFCNNNTPDAIDGSYTDGGGNSLLYCPPPIPVPDTCPADVNNDGTVGINDFLDLLAAWGPCP